MSHYNSKTQIENHTFDNGLRLIYQKNPTTIPLTSMQIFCNVGSAFEVDKHRGMAHMVEHMVFKGTSKKLPKEIFELFDRIGAEFNAYTSKRLTCYTIKCDSAYIKKCIPVMGDMLFKSTFPKKEYMKEKEVVREENVKDKNDESRVNYQHFCEIAYDGSSFVHPVDTLEYHDSKNEWTLEKVVEWYKHYYQPQHMVVSIVSSLSCSMILRLLKKSDFVKATQKIVPEVKGLRFPMGNLKESCKQYVVCNKKEGMSNTHLIVGFPSYSCHDADRFKMILLQQLLNGMSGRLFMLLREETPLTYRCYTETENEEFGGYFACVVECSNDNLFSYKDPDNKKRIKKGVMPVLVGMLRKLCQNGVSAKELEFAKTQIRNSNMMQYEDIDHFCDHNGRFALIFNNKEFVSFDQVYDAYFKDISVKQMNACIREVFLPDKMIVTLLSNQPPTVEKLKSYCF